MTALAGPVRPEAGESDNLGRMIILNADDYAMTEGVSRAIGELAAARRLSATSVLATSPNWPATAPRLLVHRPHLSIGLHLDLTLGPPLGPMPRLAPAGAFPGLSALLSRAALGLLEPAEIRAEIERQCDRFERGVGAPPDHVDGHQHVHVLPGVRGVLLEVMARRYGASRPLLRILSDPISALSAPLPVRLKAVGLGMMAIGFGSAARRHGLPVNDTFGGVSNFDLDEPYAGELERALQRPGRRHLVMCHPGHPDADLARIDTIVARRRMEYDVLMRDPSLPERIWRPSRRPDGPPIAWPELQDASDGARK